MQRGTIAKQPILKAGGIELEKCTPLGVHCDAVQISKASNDSIYVRTSNSLLGRGATKQTGLLITVLKKNRVVKDGATLDTQFFLW